MIEINISDDAKEDIRESASYYESQQANLGHSFLDKIDEALERIKQNPKQFPTVYKEVRKVLVGRFPYQILFVMKSFSIIVFGVFHSSRNRDIWKERADNELIK